VEAGMAKIMIVVGHPHADSYCEALGEAYRRGAEESGHQAQLFALARMHFDAILREGYRREQVLEPDLATARQALKASDHLVFVFPLWCGDMPAILKGFIERVLQPDLLAIQAAGGKASWKVLAGKSARVIMTMGMPGWFYRWYFGAHALKLLKRNILHFTGVRPVRSTIHGMIESVSDDTRKEWLREAEACGHQAN
jgi:NAD(P)H dehydrogenase (quinone)